MGPYGAIDWQHLKPSTRNPAEANAVKFDLALTVCAMRYISDLHIGKVNPKHWTSLSTRSPGNTTLPNS